MIDFIKSAELNNMSVDDLKIRFKKYPRSGKVVWCVCNICGRGRYLRFCDCHDMCHRCANSTIEKREKNSKQKTEYWETHPELRDDMSIRMLNCWSDPEWRENNRNKLKQWWAVPGHKEEASIRTTNYLEDHPEVCEEHSLKVIKYYEDNPEAGINASLVKTKWWDDHPEANDEMSIRMKGYWDSQEHRDEQSERLLQYYIDNPDARDERSEIRIQFLKDNPDFGENHSKLLIEYYKNNLEAREMSSALHQGIPYEEWTGFSERYNNYKNCVFLNDPFPGCHRHHMAKTLIICIPGELHNHIRHSLKTGYNMGEINLVALQYINGGL